MISLFQQFSLPRNLGRLKQNLSRLDRNMGRLDSVLIACPPLPTYDHILLVQVGYKYGLAWFFFEMALTDYSGQYIPPSPFCTFQYAKTI